MRSIRKAKGITIKNFNKEKWDKYLDEYYNGNINGKEEVISPPPRTTIKSSLLSYTELKSSLITLYRDKGYSSTQAYIYSLYNKSKISLLTRSQLLSHINVYHSLPRRERKKLLSLWIRSLEIYSLKYYSYLWYGPS